jgi:hypothetical protein
VCFITNLVVQFLWLVLFARSASLFGAEAQETIISYQYPASVESPYGGLSRRAKGPGDNWAKVENVPEWRDPFFNP